MPYAYGRTDDGFRGPGTESEAGGRPDRPDYPAGERYGDSGDPGRKREPQPAALRLAQQCPVPSDREPVFQSPGAAGPVHADEKAAAGGPGDERPPGKRGSDRVRRYGYPGGAGGPGAPAAGAGDHGASFQPDAAGRGKPDPGSRPSRERGDEPGPPDSAGDDLSAAPGPGSAGSHGNDRGSADGKAAGPAGGAL